MQKSNPKMPIRKPQRQQRPGNEYKMDPVPVYDNAKNKGSGKLYNKVAFVTGGDSGIGRAVCILFAKEGADVIILYYNEHKDAEDTKDIIEKQYGRKCLLISGDISKERFCVNAIGKAVKHFKRIDVLVNNAAIHFESKSLTEISTKQLVKTFETNIFS